MHLPINERFTSVQKDDLKAALGKVVNEGETRETAAYVAKCLRDELGGYMLTETQVNNIVDTITGAIFEYGPASETIPADREGPSGSGHVPALQIHAACEAIESERVIVSTDGRMVTVQPETLVEGVRGQMLVSACLK